MKVIWSASAARHLRELVEYIQGESLVGAVTMRRRILETVRRVGEMPYSGRIGLLVGTREALVPQSPYIVVYQIFQQEVNVLGIWHGAREWPNNF